MCESVSIVPPDFDDTMKSVLSRFTAFSASRTAAGSVESRTCSLGEPGMSPNERRITSGPRLEPPIPSSTTSLKPEQDSANERRSSLLEHLLADRQPAELVADLRHAGAAPERLVLAPDLLRHPIGGGLLHEVDELRLEVVRDRGADGGRPARDDALARGLDPRDQLVEGLDELRDPVAEQLVGHVLHVDAGAVEGGQVVDRVLVRRVPLHLGALRRGEQRGHRHRVHGVRGHELVDVLCLGVLRVLDAGGRPQRPLHQRPPRGPRRSARRGRAP